MKDQIIALLLYFDVFDYPLKEKEVLTYLNISGKNREDAQNCLHQLVQEELISNSENFYFIGNSDSKVIKRKEANRLARKRIKTASRFSRIISWFPYVRGVYLSGSISKGVMKKNDDIDYFIVTKPGRLWLSRTLLTLFKKIFLFNSYRNFCINYFVDTETLKVNEINRYNATEIVFLVPVFNYSLYEKMLEENEWVKSYYPGFTQGKYLCREKDIWVKKLLENLIEPFAEKLDRYLHNRSVNFIREKFKDNGEDYFENSFCLKRNELKYFPEHQQIMILDRFNKKLAEFRNQGKAFTEMSGQNLAKL